MPKIIWFNQPTNHSGYLNLIYLTADRDVGMDRMYTDLANGCFIMGGPTLIEDGEATDAAHTLISFLGKGFHFFPQYSEKKIRQEVEENKEEVSDTYRTYAIFDDVNVFSKDYSNTECVNMLLSGTTPESPIVFIDMSEDGDAILCRELARIYYGLSKEKREELGLKHDWHLPSDG
jgi:hypothetical protein